MQDRKMTEISLRTFLLLVFFLVVLVSFIGYQIGMKYAPHTTTYDKDGYRYTIYHENGRPVLLDKERLP